MESFSLSSRTDLNSSGCFSEAQRRWGRPHWFHDLEYVHTTSSPHCCVMRYSTINGMFTVPLCGSGIFALGMCWLCLIVLRWKTGRAWRILRKHLPFNFTWAACFESGPCQILASHVILNSPFSTGHLLKCTVLNLTSGYRDNWPLCLIFHKKIKPFFSKKLILSHWQAMFSAVCVPLTEFRVDLIHL